MVSQVFSFIHKKQTSKNVADTTFKLKKSPFLHHTWYHGIKLKLTPYLKLTP